MIKANAPTRKFIYITILTAIIAFLIWIGPKPWSYIISNWKVFLSVMCISATGIVVQAMSYRSLSTTGKATPTPLQIIQIWSMSGALSVAMPFLAGFGARTALLVRKGMPLTGTLLTSARQGWMGLEYALAIGAIAAIFINYKEKIWLVAALGLGWLFMVAFRVIAQNSAIQKNNQPNNKIQRLTQSLSLPIANITHIWFATQMLLMGAIYYIAFHGFGADANLATVLLLASITILASVIIIIPNGMGVMDGIWVMIGMHSNLELSQSVAFALTLRLSYLASATLVWIIASSYLYLTKSKIE